MTKPHIKRPDGTKKDSKNRYERDNTHGIGAFGAPQAMSDVATI
jgi:hypothetical protein